MEKRTHDNFGHKKTAFTVMRPTRSFALRVMTVQKYIFLVLMQYKYS